VFENISVKPKFQTKDKERDKKTTGTKKNRYDKNNLINRVLHHA